MHKLLKAILLSLLLVACGSNTNTASTSANSNSPLAELPTIPAEAQITDYFCETVEEYSFNGIPTVARYTDTGVFKAWKTEDGFMQVFEESADGEYKQHQKIQKIVIDDTTYKRHIESISWNKEGSSWTKRKDFIERTYSLNNTTSTVIKNIVNGIERPFYWTSEVNQTSEKSFKVILRHTNPSIRNFDGRLYSSVVQTCIENDR